MACARGGRGGSAADSKVRAAIITDSAGVDDKSFNQSAWEGLQAWGKANKLEKDSGYTYFQSNSESDFATNLSSAVDQNYNLIFGVSFRLHDAISESAKDNEKINYVIIDDVIKDQKNVESVLFADNEGAYLCRYRRSNAITKQESWFHRWSKIRHNYTFRSWFHCRS